MRTMVCRRSATLLVLFLLLGSPCAPAQEWHDRSWSGGWRETLIERDLRAMSTLKQSDSARLPLRTAQAPSVLLGTPVAREARLVPAPSALAPAPTSTDSVPPLSPNVEVIPPSPEDIPGNWQLHARRLPQAASYEEIEWSPPRRLPDIDQIDTFGLPDSIMAETASPGFSFNSFQPENSVGRRPWPYVVRFGWWNSSFSGSPTKIGEYQSLRSSPFWDVDRVVSDGQKTLDFSLTGFDNDATQLGLRYIGPSLSVDVEYDRYLRRLDRDPLSAFVDHDQQPAAPLPPPPANFRDMKEDLTVGQDFAIRVQELRSNFKGKLTKNIDWRLNIWAMRKRGQRQVVALGHCFTATNATDVNGNPVTGVACHVLSQSQRIDWLTMELEPAVQAQFGPVSVEYSRTMRALTTNDQLTTRPYDNFGFNGDLPYAVVPENFTQIDRLKMGVRFPDRRDLYARFFVGNTENQYRDTLRRFRGYDVRFTDRSIEGVSLTAYTNGYIQKGNRPTTLFAEESAATIRMPLGYDRMRLGFRSRWRPFLGEPSWRSRLSLSGGYEYGELRRSNAIFVEQALTANQSLTTTNVAQIRASMRWSPQFDSYVAYRVGIIADPLYGVPVRNTTTNTSLPTDEHLVDVGVTWMPSDTLLLSGSLGTDNSGNTSNIASFQQDDYNITLTAWYAPSARWNVSGGLAFLRSWIAQDITLGSKTNPVTLPWTFGGQSDVVNIGTTYAWTESITLSGGYEFIRSSNIAYSPPPYSDIPPLSDEIVEVSRFSTGVDYRWRPRIGWYFRYQFFDYEDRAQSFNSGTSDMLLFGADAIY